MIRFTANLFRIAMLAAGTEETRYYLKGVYVQPHALKGVTLTATDGHKAVSFYDENGFANESAIVALQPEALKACKPGRNERRDVTIADGNATVNITTIEHEGVDAKGKPCGAQKLVDAPVAFTKGCFVDGTYPDYRRVFPAGATFSTSSTSPAFSTLVMDKLSKIAAELALHYGVNAKGGVMQINASDSSAPALVTFPPKFNAIAVAMPMRSVCENEQPAWFNAAPRTQDDIDFAQAAE